MNATEKSQATSLPKVFTFNESNRPVRVEVINNEPYFAAKDVSRCLGLENSSQAISKLDDDEKGVITNDTLGGKQNLAAVNESGLYNLIFQSRKPQAKSFRKWVTSEVLPSIRKTGKYEAAISDPTRLKIAEGVELRVIPSDVHGFLVTTKEISRALKVSKDTIRANKCRGDFKEGVHILSNYEVKDADGLLPVQCTVYTRKGLMQQAYHLRSGYSRQLRDWAEDFLMGRNSPRTNIKALPQKRRHNRLTDARLLDIMRDVCQINDVNLRISISDKLMGGH